MWWGPGQDPGGTEGAGPSQPPPNQELRDLQDQFEHQQVLIAQLKEMLRKNELTTAAQEKVEECANKLNKISARPKRGKVRPDNQDISSTISMVEGKSSSGIKKKPGSSDKINLLKQQLEETKAKLAERDRSQREIGEMVTQLNTQLDNSQQAISGQTSLNTTAAALDESLNIYLYTSHSTPEDLYSALQIKDKHITELTEKVAQLEANIIDLRENLKEKDSVIDARTKAITLMTESLSKKGKNTLDMLDDTKEQMRKMQENFVTLESEMKEERDRLLEELKLKSCEIATLAETNMELERNQVNLQERIESQNYLLEKYKTDLFEYEEKIAELNKFNDSLNIKLAEKNEGIQSVELENKIKELENKLKETNVSTSQTDSDELAKLKKQLDENNKTTIKLKAQSKAKIKELQKKIDTFKNASDVNAELLKLQSSNEKLTQKIAELEEEKGNLQLQVVESDSFKAAKEEMQKKVDELTTILQQRETEIAKFETDAVAFEERIKALNEKVFVSSEITTIHLEEQLESLDKEKKELLQENRQFSDQIEQLKKEKNEIDKKLETYVQENIELVDKLEKMSAEKVSSAESIEIVENLTQQEKLELEAYNKNIGFVPDAVKSSDDNLSQTMELNDSVNELTEETSELMAKIELFTEERKEVMEKMDLLATENVELNAKIREIENNRDALVETYELLQNEKDSLENEISQLKQKIESLSTENEELHVKMENQPSTPTRSEKLTKGKKKSYEKEIQEYKRLIENQKVEIKSLQEKLAESGELKIQVENLEKANKKLEDNTLKICNEKDTLAENYGNVQDQLMSIQNQYQKLLIENERLEKQIKTTSENVFEKDMMDQELRSTQLRANEIEAKLLSSMQEIEEYQKIIEDNKNELIASADTINKLQSTLNEKQEEIDHLNGVITDLNTAISKLEFENNQNASQSETMNEMLSQLNDLKVVFNENMTQLQFYEQELEENTQTIEIQRKKLKELTERVHEMENLLSSKNEEIRKLEKERENNTKILDDLEEESAEKEENFQQAIRDLKQKYETLAKQIDKNSGSLDDIKGPLEEKIKQLEKECAEKENKNKEQVEKMKKLAANLKKKAAAYQELESKYNSFKEKYENEHQEKDIEEKEANETKITSLVAQLNEMEEELSKYKTIESNENGLLEKLEQMKNEHEITQNAMQMKIREHESVIESLETDIIQYKQRIDKLEVGLSNIEERRLSLEKTAIQLGLELEEKTSMCKEVCETEDMLEKRLAALTVHDEMVEKRLQEAVSENQQLSASIASLQQTNEVLRSQLHSANHFLNENDMNAEKLTLLENENTELHNTIVNMKKTKEELRRKLEEKATEFDTLETELTMQLAMQNNERKAIMERFQQLQETYSLAMDELEQYKKQCEALQTFLCAKDKQIQMLTEEFNATNDSKLAVNADENYLQIEQLRELINQKEYEIENYQRQNIQLQMELSNPINTTTIELFNQKETNKREEILQTEINALRYEIYNLNKKLQEKNYEIEQQRNMYLENVAKNEVEEVISKAYEKVIQDHQLQKDEDKFDKTHVFDLSNQLQVEEAVLEVSRSFPLGAESSATNNTKDLLQKIKTLEFMLYNMEQEKLDALMQCQRLSEEVTTLVYKKEQFKEIDPDFSGIEGQVLSEEAARTETPEMHKQLVDLEFTKPNKIQPHADGQPVVEDVIQPASAYLCYDEETESKPKKQHTSAVDVESQIFPAEAARALTPEERKELSGFEFTKTDKICSHPQKQPVTEETIHPKKTYLCYDDEEEGESSKKDQKKAVKLVKFDSFIENDDGWAWGAEEAKLEEEYRQQVASVLPDKKVEELENKVQTLEAEVKKLQIKSAKLVKKLKELKSQNENLNAQLKATSSSGATSGFPDLDDAIQEELKLQINRLEKRLKELSNENEKEKAEKENLLKRVDVLTSANERFVENKEKQDVEVQLLQQKNRELSSKLEQFEWENDGFSMQSAWKSETSEASAPQSDDKATEFSQKIEELNNTIKELTLDNEELQALLEEQRAIRLEAEKTKIHFPDNMITEAEYSKVVEERNLLKERVEDYDKVLKIKKNLEKDALIKEEIIAENDEVVARFIQEIENLRTSNGQINEKLQNYLESYENSSRTVLKLQEEKTVLETTIAEHMTTFEKLNTLYEAISSQKLALTTEMENLRQEKEELNILLNQSTTNNSKLQTELLEKNQEIERFKIGTTTDNILQEELELKTQELAQLRESITFEQIEFNNKLTSTVDQLAKEWAERVDQRGTDVAESWKLHVEARENEFMQLENQLRNEISELEEKCNGLVNENNELRKNVDAEIRNEVDRIAALQQQINDKERIIKDLTVQFHEQRSYLEQQVSLLQTLQEQMQDKDKSIAENAKKFEEIQKELEDKNTFIENLEKQISNLQETIEMMHKQIRDSESEKNRNMEEVSGLQKQLADNMQKIDVLSTEKQHLASEIQNINDSLQKRLDEKHQEYRQQNETLLASWQQKIEEKELEVQNLLEKLDEFKHQNQKKSSVQDQLTTQQQTIENLNQQLQENQWQIYSSVSTIESLQQQMNEKQETINYLQSELDKNMNQMETLNNDLVSYQQSNEALLAKDEEIARLTALINEKDGEYNRLVQEKKEELKNALKENSAELQQLKNRSAENDNRSEELLCAKDADLQSIRVQLQESVSNYEKLIQERDDMSIELAARNIAQDAHLEKIRTVEDLVRHDRAQIEDMQRIIEEQVLKIEELKRDLFEKSRDYDALIAEVEVEETGKMQATEKRVHFANEPAETIPPAQSSASVDDDPSEPVSRAELDLALYMLHQRDVRCEELTVELMQLLEERDTLQLRLSNAIREKEEIAANLKISPRKSGPEATTANADVPTTPTSTGAVPKSKSIILGATGTELATEVTEHYQDSTVTSEDLKNKLSQLRSMGYNRDVRIRDDQEARHLQQLSLMQQHRDVASKLPPEAAARLVDANYTLSRDVQSPSKVLLNWLWGRSTPKVNNI